MILLHSWRLQTILVSQKVFVVGKPSTTKSVICPAQYNLWYTYYKQGLDNATWSPEWHSFEGFKETKISKILAHSTCSQRNTLSSSCGFSKTSSTSLMSSSHVKPRRKKRAMKALVSRRFCQNKGCTVGIVLRKRMTKNQKFAFKPGLSSIAQLFGRC